MRRSGARWTDGLQVLLLFALFAVSILWVLLSGAGAYHRMTERDERSFNRRTALQYVASRVRGTDAVAVISDFAGEGSTLCLLEDLDGEPYVTRIYCWDGMLQELFSAAGDEWEPADGTEILPAQELHFAMEDRFLTAELLQPEGTTASLTLLIRTGEVLS